MNFYGNDMGRMLNARNPQMRAPMMGAPNQAQARLPVYNQIAAQMSQPQTAAPMQAPVTAQAPQSDRMTIPRAIMKAPKY